MTDIYAVRVDGAITALYAHPVDGSAPIADDDPEVVVFRRYRTSDLTDIAAILSRRVDAEAEAARMAWVTPGTGQAASYIYKAQQAHAVLAAPDPQAADPDDYPLLASTIGIDGPDLVSVAQVVIATEAAWVVVLAAIEAARKAAKAAISTANTIAEAEAAATVAWPQPET